MLAFLARAAGLCPRRGIGTSCRVGAKKKIRAKKSRERFDPSEAPRTPVREPWTAAPEGTQSMEYPDPDPDIPLADRLRRLRKELPEELKEYWKEKTTMQDTRDFLLDTGPKKDGELKLEYGFKELADFDRWEVSSDAYWSEGFSTGELVPTKNGTAVFRGNLVQEVPKTGNIHKAGWVVCRSKRELLAFGREYYNFDYWNNFTHFVCKVRGDGRTYLCNLNSPGHFNTSWGNIYSFPLYTHGGPYWQITKIPFSKFYLNVQGRIQDSQTPLRDDCRVSSVGFTMMDRMDGEFRLEIDWIGVYFDISWLEETAYEMYKTPIIHFGNVGA